MSHLNTHTHPIYSCAPSLSPLLLLSPSCSVQVRELVGSRLSVSNTEQLPQLPLLHTWGAAAAADAPQQPEGFTLLPSGLGGDTQVMLQQQAAWGLQVPSLFEWQPARFASMAQQQGQEDEEEDGQKQRAGHTWADLQVWEACVLVC